MEFSDQPQAPAPLPPEESSRCPLNTNLDRTNYCWDSNSRLSKSQPIYRSD